MHSTPDTFSRFLDLRRLQIEDIVNGIVRMAMVGPGRTR